MRMECSARPEIWAARSCSKSVRRIIPATGCPGSSRRPRMEEASLVRNQSVRGTRKPCLGRFVTSSGRYRDNRDLSGAFPSPPARFSAPEMDWANATISRSRNGTRHSRLAYMLTWSVFGSICPDSCPRISASNIAVSDVGKAIIQSGISGLTVRRRSLGPENGPGMYSGSSRSPKPTRILRRFSARPVDGEVGSRCTMLLAASRN